MDKELQNALTEAKDILQHLSKEERKKIPLQLRKIIVDNYDSGHQVSVDDISKKTYALLAVLNRKYLAENKEELQMNYQEDLKKHNENRN